MRTIELLSPAGSMEAVYAACANGADAVYVGGGDFNARRNAKNLSNDEMLAAIRHCRLRGVSVYVTINTLQNDRELTRCEDYVRFLNRAGANAVIVQDLGAARMIRQIAPELKLHASTQASVHDLEGVRMLAELGFSRVILARELSRYQIAYICKSSAVDIEVFVHGALCMSYSGQCYMSSVIGRRSGNRGLCAQPCRLPYAFGGSAGELADYPLSLKDLNLSAHLVELETLGVRSLKIEGRMKRPEYVAAVTKAYARALDSGSVPSREEQRELESVFSRQGFTDGYYTRELGPKMFGIREDIDEKAYRAQLAEIKKTYRDGDEYRKIPVSFHFSASPGKPARLEAEDDRGNKANIFGAVVMPARSRETSAAEAREQLVKTGGTPWHVNNIELHIEPGVNIPAAVLNEVRRAALAVLEDERAKPPERAEEKFIPGYQRLNPRDEPVFTVSATKREQVVKELLALKPARVFLPVDEILDAKSDISAMLEAGHPIGAALPRVIGDYELNKFLKKLDEVCSLGIRFASAGSLGMIGHARERGLCISGDFGLNAMNSQSLKELKKLGVSSQVLSFELSLPQARDIIKCMDTELIVYGRLPLMITESCIIKNRYGSCGYCKNNQSLIDRRGESFPVMKEYGCRNVILNAHKLFLPEKIEDFKRIGLWGFRLLFTTENARECVSVAEAYRGVGSYEPQTSTHGLYYRGVE